MVEVVIEVEKRLRDDKKDTQKGFTNLWSKGEDIENSSFDWSRP